MSDAATQVFLEHDVQGLGRDNLDEFFSAVMASVMQNIDNYTDYVDDLVFSRATRVDDGGVFKQKTERPCVLVSRKGKPEYAEVFCAVELGEDASRVTIGRMGEVTDLYKTALETGLLPRDLDDREAVEDEDMFYTIVSRAAELPATGRSHIGCGGCGGDDGGCGDCGDCGDCGGHHHEGGCGGHHHDGGCGGHHHHEGGCGGHHHHDGGCGGHHHEGGCGGCGHDGPVDPVGDRQVADWAEKVFDGTLPEEQLLGHYLIKNMGEDELGRVQLMLREAIAQTLIHSYEMDDLHHIAVVPTICLVGGEQECPAIITLRDDRTDWADVFVALKPAEDEDGCELAVGFTSAPSAAYQELIASDVEDVDAHTPLGEECAFYGTVIAVINDIFGID